MYTQVKNLKYITLWFLLKIVYNFIRMETDICGINVLIVEIVIIVSYRGNN